MANAYVQVTLRTDATRVRLKRAVFNATQKVFELDTKKLAKELSPVSPTYPSIPASRGEKRIDHGTNRNSIDTAVEQTPEGVRAAIFTESGHGGYLELGTRKMPARPYLGPAVQQTVGKIPLEVKEELANG